MRIARARAKMAFHLEVVCDIYNLPFKPNSFSVVHASHILEHLKNPCEAIKELAKSCNQIVIINVPNASFYKWKNYSSEHISSWNHYTLDNLLSTVFAKVRIMGTPRQIKRNKLAQFLMLIIRLFYGQEELTAVCYKSCQSFPPNTMARATTAKMRAKAASARAKPQH